MTIFNTNCTLPPNVVTFVMAPNVRGTLDIVWSCLSIMFICTWSILHLNVPVQSSPCNKRQKHTRALSRLFWKITWMILNVLAPEWALGKALSDYCAVSGVTADFNAMKDEDDVPWSRIHTYFGNMGGFALSFDKSTAPTPQLEGSTANNAKVQKEADFRSSRQTAAATPELSIVHLNRAAAAPPVGHANSLYTHMETSRKHRSDLSLPHKLSIRERPATVQPAFEEPEQASLPIVLKDWLAFLESQGLPFIRSSGSLSRSIGAIDWRIDETNSTSASKAIQAVTLNFFQNPWEKQKFLRCYQHWFFNLKALQGSIWVLDANQLLLARRLGIIKRLPEVSEDDISDRNKGDFFVKIIAVGQILWFIIQLITRLCLRIPTSQLEVLTFAFATSTAFTYSLLLDKPKDIQYSVVISATRYANPEEMSRLALVGPTMFGLLRQSIWIPNNSMHSIRTRQDDISPVYLAMGATFSLVIFGTIHCVAWDFTFPTHIERLLWQISSIVTIAALPAASAVGFITGFISRVLSPKTAGGFVHFPPLKKSLDTTLAIPLAALFVASRIFIIVEVFRSLAFLPPQAFLTTWPNDIPHIG